MKVSVLLICYNQENYIKAALESILSQKTTFQWELLIGDDASTDQTAQIISQCIQQHVENCTVRPSLRRINLGASKNLFDLIRQAKGEYLTFLEGDDYWLDDHHLQILVDYLDKHNTLAGVSYRRERRQNDVLIKHDPEESLVGRRFTLQDYYDGKLFSAMACVFRNIYSADYDGYEYLFTGARNACDLVICYTILFSGDIFILDKTLGVYRIFSGGYCSQTGVIRHAEDYLIQNRRLMERYGTKAAMVRGIKDLHVDIMKTLLKSEGIGALVRYYTRITPEEKRGVLTLFGKAVLRKIRRR